jgi:glutamate-1-semialdehyde 2,1-aminomutase
MSEQSPQQESHIESYGSNPLSTYENSRKLQRQALDELPEGTSTNARGESAYEPYPMVFIDRGDGATITDVDNNEYIDHLCGYSAIIAGHQVERQTEQVQAQLQKGTLFGTASELEYQTAELVNELVPGSDLTKFTCSGTEGIMSAVRLARAYTGKEKILKFEGMYHGHNDYVMVNHQADADSLGTRRNPAKIPLAPGVPEKTMETVEAIPWNDADLLAEVLERKGDEIAAVATEAVMSNGGLIRPKSGYFDEVRRLTRKHDCLLILDEVVTGFRMGLHGAQGQLTIEPDLAVFGKAMANGYPTAALTGSREVMRFLMERPGRAPFYGTYTGNPVSLAGTKANLEHLKDIGESGYREFHNRGQQLVEGLRDLARDAGHNVFIPDFAGYFFMHFVDVTANPETWTDWRDIDRNIDINKYKSFARAMIGEGVYFLPKFGRINMTHAHTDEHIETTLEAAKTAINAVPE